MAITNYALKEYFGPNFEALAKINIPALDFDLDRKYVQEFIRNSIFFQLYDASNKPVAFYLLRRTQQIIKLYTETVQISNQWKNRGSSRIPNYLDILNNLENIISSLYQCFNLVSKNTKLYTSGDGSQLDRLNRCYNRIKHLEMSTIPADFIQSTYIDEDKFYTPDSYISFVELKELILQVKNGAERLLNPNTALP